METAKNRWVAAILAFLFGTIGVHNFYLGEKKEGVKKIILTCTVIGIIYTWIAGLIDFVTLLVMSDREFNQQYN